MLHVNRVFCIIALLIMVQSAEAAKTATLKHDDGSQEGKRSMTGGGHAVRFECPDGETWYLKALSIHGSRYGAGKAPNEDFKVVVASDDLKRRQEIGKPYSLFKRGKEEWVRFGIDPVEVRGAFHVAVFFNPTRTKGVYVGIDTNPTTTHSAIVLASAPDKKESDLQGDWMIRAHLVKQIKGKAKTLLDATTLGKQKQQEEAAHDAKILGEARSLTLKHDTGSMDEHMNIQGALYTAVFETPKNVEGYVWQVQVYASQFGGQHDSEAVNGDVYILDKNRQVITRTTFPYSLATQEKQWIKIPTLPTKVKGKFYVSIDTHGTKFKGLYMGYQDGNKKQVASTDELEDNRVQTGDWSKKFNHMQWMIRTKVADRPVVY
ncbi:MAG: hypothetical protein MI725_03100 [Pirellulales bacterium]|nr:hypothetical protein [Pirellulales bacterium]